MNDRLTFGLWLILSAIIGAAVTAVFIRSDAVNNNVEASVAKDVAPLYWVAPMDSNYRRDKPGKSPMGMDLIPVFGESEAKDVAGEVKISPDIVNNLGVRTAMAELGPLRSSIKTVGYVRYNEDKLIHIHPRVEGWIEDLFVKSAGDPVVKGQPLYTVYSPELVNAQEELILALKSGQSRLIYGAESRLSALRFPEKIIKKLRKTRQVEQAVTFYAPQSGVVDALNIRQGFFIQPGTTLMSIGSLDQVWVEAEVFEGQAASVVVGAPVTMTLDFLPGREWRGEVDFVHPTLDEKTRTLKVRLRFDNPDAELKPNMFAQVIIAVEDDTPTLLVPREAVIRTGSSDRIVLALGKGRFKSVVVTLGRVEAKYAEILSGITAGQKVVTSAQFLLDSESSKSADFERMNHDDGAGMNHSATQASSEAGAEQ